MVTEIGLHFYREASLWDNARWYDSSLGRFAQADTIIPSMQGVQAWDRFAYTNNNPVRYTDPSGHGIDCGLGESCVTDPYTSPLSGSTSSSGDGSVRENKETTHSSYMGGATPAGVFEWQHFDNSKTSNRYQAWADFYAEMVTLLDMHSPKMDPALKAFITYVASGGNVVHVEIAIVNEGASSATLVDINMSEETPPGMNACIATADCYFKPNSSVYIDPGEVEFITICKNCLEDGSTIYTHPFTPNKNNYIEVLMTLSMPIDHGYEGVQYTPMPFIYTIPPR